ncbi:hypothetical protein [Rhizobium hidalgonense]|uniref:hypothetical protein n=1 Tax=Rhizobium hidalgonense TaxID=1538159 RepID=UPI0013FD5380|nr:hypothetical protein [Rhizobium hidalgonense]
MPAIAATHKRFARFLAAAKTCRWSNIENSIYTQSLKINAQNWHTACRAITAQINGDQRSMRAQ